MYKVIGGVFPDSVDLNTNPNINYTNPNINCTNPNINCLTRKERIYTYHMKQLNLP